MINLLKLETYKLKHSRSFLFITAAVIVFEIFYVVNNGSLIGAEAFKHSMYDVSTTVLLGAVFTGLFVGSDFADRTINQAVTAGYSRLNILISKSIVFYLSVEIITIVYPLTSVIINTCFNGWGEEFTIVSLLYVIRTVLLRFVIDAGCASLWLLIAFIFKDVGKTISVSMIIFVVGAGALTILSKKNAAAQFIYTLTANSQARIIVNKAVTSYNILFTCLSNLIMIVLFCSISYIIFRRAELK